MWNKIANGKHAINSSQSIQHNAISHTGHSPGKEFYPGSALTGGDFLTPWPKLETVCPYSPSVEGPDLIKPTSRISAMITLFFCMFSSVDKNALPSQVHRAMPYSNNITGVNVVQKNCHLVYVCSDSAHRGQCKLIPLRTFSFHYRSAMWAPKS